MASIYYGIQNISSPVISPQNTTFNNSGFFYTNEKIFDEIENRILKRKGTKINYNQHLEILSQVENYITQNEAMMISNQSMDPIHDYNDRIGIIQNVPILNFPNMALTEFVTFQPSSNFINFIITTLSPHLRNYVENYIEIDQLEDVPVPLPQEKFDSLSKIKFSELNEEIIGREIDSTCPICQDECYLF